MLTRCIRFLFRPGVAWSALAFLTLTITVLSLVPHPEDYVPVNLWDKLSHFLGYGALATALGHALGLRRPAARASVIAALVGAGYGALLEVVQAVATERTGSGLDAVANALGASLGGLVAAAWLLGTLPVRTAASGKSGSCRDRASREK